MQEKLIVVSFGQVQIPYTRVNYSFLEKSDEINGIFIQVINGFFKGYIESFCSACSYITFTR